MVHCPTAQEPGTREENCCVLLLEKPDRTMSSTQVGSMSMIAGVSSSVNFACSWVLVVVGWMPWAEKAVQPQCEPFTNIMMDWWVGFPLGAPTECRCRSGWQFAELGLRGGAIVQIWPL